VAALDIPGWRMLGFGLSGRATSHLLALCVQLGGDSRALGVVCPSFGLFVVLGLGDWCLEGCGVLAPLPPCAWALLSPSTLKGKVRLGFIRGLTLLSRHHSPSLSIVDEFNF